MKDNPEIPEAREAIIDPVSYSAIPIALKNIDTDQLLASASGFLYRVKTTYFLITNWHNFTGVNPNTKKRLGWFSASPTSVVVPFLEQKSPFIKWQRRIIPLYDKKEKPQWYIHPQFKENVDVAVLKIGINDQKLPLNAINENDFEDISAKVADNVYILGFPHNLSSGGKFPLWKRGSIASEPDIDLDNLPKFLVDSASRPGMSGAPVIYRRQGIHRLVDGTITPSSLIGEIQNFCGVYSGRINTNTELDTQLGIVWKAEVIPKIIDGKKRDKGYYPHMSFA